MDIVQNIEAQGLKKDIPEFRPENLDAEPGWHNIASVEEIPLDETQYLEVDGRHLFVHRTPESIRVYDSRCPHQVTDIPHLALEGGKLTCPKHGWGFDIATGACVEKGNRPLNRFQHKEENGWLMAYW